MNLIGSAVLRASDSLRVVFETFGITFSFVVVAVSAEFVTLSSPQILAEKRRVRFALQLCLLSPRTHDKECKTTKENEKKSCNILNMNGKYFVAPQRSRDNFKRLFARLAAEGAGRPLDLHGFPDGPWTPETLTQAICDLSGNNKGIDLRTVQLWFQANDNGIGADNIRWLAQIFGCRDPEATSLWQAELTAAKERLKSQRRAAKKKQATDPPEEKSAKTIVLPEKIRGFSLARRSEAIFSGSPLDLPSCIFAGAVALGLSSYFLGIHSVTYGDTGASLKQVGFIWAPNWTILFMVFLPLFCAFVIELIHFWKNEGRLTFLPEGDRERSGIDWSRRIKGSSLTYWSVFVMCVGFAGLFQWIGVRFTSLTSGGGDYAIDWGTLALVRPDVISVPQALGFTGLAYLYMCLCFYLFFVGLILLYTLAYDLWDIARHSEHASEKETHDVSLRVMRGIFRCTLLGIMVATCMKLQSFYLTSSGTSFPRWLVDDILSVLGGSEVTNPENTLSRPTHYTSLLVTLASCIPFLYGSIRIGFDSSFHRAWVKMTSIISLLTISYLMIGAFTGFSILLFFGIMIAVYGLFDPDLGKRTAGGRKGDQIVS